MTRGEYNHAHTSADSGLKFTRMHSGATGLENAHTKQYNYTNIKVKPGEVMEQRNMNSIIFSHCQYMIKAPDM